ncbi:MAG: transposase [Desulfobulbus sp.]|nr:transposase [Desulfobulbus sp.]
MARVLRKVVPGFPHHITQRGVRSMDVFHSDEDRRQYLQFLSEEASRYGVDILAWCLMTNHVHFIVIPDDETCLVRGFCEGSRRYTRMKNFSQECDARYHAGLTKYDPFVKDRTRKGLITNWQEFISQEDDERIHHLRRVTRTGRPAGSEDFIQRIERVTGRDLSIVVPGRPRKQS